MINENPIKVGQPVKLSFQHCPESLEEEAKRKFIEQLFIKYCGHIDLTSLRELACAEHGLVTDYWRSKFWPQLAQVNIENLEPAPQLSDLRSHIEYTQVVLDVNRSLKRFPPGIPYEQRIALQDQLTVLILRVINKYPNLRYYQGYHDVAVTFLLVVGEEIAFAIMEALSTTHFSECMQETMEATQKRLMFMWPIVNFENKKLFTFLQRSGVGTLFALPWYLTWFGHSLNSYKAVVRLYDYFLASPIYMPIFVTAAIILHRANDILSEDCDMASIHCVLSKLPEDLPIEILLRKSRELYDKYPLAVVEKEVEKLLHEEKHHQQRDDRLSLEKRNNFSRNGRNRRRYAISQWMHNLMTPTSLIATTAFSLLVGICAYYYKIQYIHNGIS